MPVIKMTIINFNKNFYSWKAMKSAIEAYQGLTNFKVKNNQKYIQVSLTKPNKELAPIIKGEFANYVLFLSLTEKQK